MKTRLMGDSCMQKKKKKVIKRCSPEDWTTFVEMDLLNNEQPIIFVWRLQLGLYFWAAFDGNVEYK